MRDVDTIITQVAQRMPAVQCRQLKVSHPGVDDDGLWYFWLSDQQETVQIESSSGMLPFIIESDERSDLGDTVAKVVERIVEWLHG